MPRQPPLWRFLAIALLAPLAFIASVVWLQGEYQRGESIRREARASYDRRIEVINLLSEMRRAETSQRGYVVTGDPEFLSQYRMSKTKVASAANRVIPSLRAYAPEHPHFSELGRIVAVKLSEMDDVIRLMQTDGSQAARARVSQGEGKRLMSRFQLIVDRMIAEEDERGRASVSAFTARIAGIRTAMWIVVGLGSLALAIALFALWSQRRRQHEIELKAYEAAQRNRAILDSTVEAILIINPSGTVEMLNAAGRRMLGYEDADLERRDISVISDIAPGTASFPERIGLVDGRIETTVLPDRVVRHRDGGMIPVDIALGVMRLPDGDHVVVSMRDIAERKRIERMKDDLISTVSHELRTPLTSIVGALGLLGTEIGGAPSEHAARLIKIADNNSRRLIRLINDMLDVDRIEAGKLRMQMRPMVLGEVVSHACEDNRGLAASQDVTIVSDIEDDVTQIVGDPDRLLQVITNLISNALRVSPAGGKITVGTARNCEDRKIIVFVDDEGPGVPPEVSSADFWSLRASHGRRRIIRHGPRPRNRPRNRQPTRRKNLVRGSICGGTRFAFCFTVASPANVSTDIDGATRILIYERDPQIARDLQTLLADDGYECRVVTTANAAREALAANGFSVLLLDMSLDDDQVFDLAREARNRESVDKLTVLLLRQGDELDPASPVPLDLIDWIEKPIDASRLKKAIWSAIPQGAVTRPVVLHLDDDQDTLEITAEALGADADILQARTLVEARNILEGVSPHIAILDVHLAKGTGLDLLGDLVDPRGAAIPTIIYSAHDVSADVAAQVDAVLTKTRTSLPDLKATIRRVVATRHRNDHQG